MKKLFPRLAKDNFFHSLKLIFIAEAYKKDEKLTFYNDCIEFVDKLLLTAPFNLTRTNDNWLSVYAFFNESKQNQPAVNQIAKEGETAFESSLNTTSGVLSFNTQKVNDYLNAAKIKIEDEDLKLSEFLLKGYPTYGATGALIIFLLPAVNNQAAGGEAENIPATEDDYYFVATTKDNHWEQVIFRAMGKTLYLGDEYDLSGDDFLDPGGYIQYFNLEYFGDTLPNTVQPYFKWDDMFSVVEKTKPIQYHRKTGDPNIPDRKLNNTMTASKKVEFWEGGGGYRTKVFRVAQDCLMRRKIGDNQLPVKQQNIPFCPVCKKYLKNIIT